MRGFTHLESEKTRRTTVVRLLYSHTDQYLQGIVQQKNQQGYMLLFWSRNAVSAAFAAGRFTNKKLSNRNISTSKLIAEYAE